MVGELFLDVAQILRYPSAFLGSDTKLIRNSTLHANPYADRDYMSLSLKYNL